MLQNLCIRITAAWMVALLAACSASDSPTSQATDSANAVPAQAAAPAPEPSDTSSGTHEVAPTEAPATPADIPAGAPAMKMFIDPVTGAPRDPTPAERAAMARQAGQRKAAQPATREEKMRNGGTAIMIEGEPTTPLKACTGADGKVAVAHDCETPAPAQQDSKGGKP
jgi:hypothetical protein